MVALPVIKWSKRRNVSLIRPKLTKRLWLCRTFSRRDSCRTSGRRVTGQASIYFWCWAHWLPDCQCCENTGAAEIVCADVSPRSLSLGKEMGADVLVNPQNDDMDHWKAEKGYFDVSFEVSGHPSSVNTCLEVTRARGVMVQVGMGGAMAEFPMMTLIGKEISLRGSFRFTSEFNTAVSWLANGVINPLPLLSAEYPFTDLEEALRFAGDKTRAAKVQLVF